MPTPIVPAPTTTKRSSTAADPSRDSRVGPVCPTLAGSPTGERTPRMSEETVETRGDDRVDIIVGDTNQDGTPDLWVSDTDGDGKADLFQFDTDHDGEVNITMVDADQDGTPDEVVDGDGGHPPQV